MKKFLKNHPFFKHPWKTIYGWWNYTQFFKVKKLGRRAEISTISFWGHFETTMTPLFADFKKKIIICPKINILSRMEGSKIEKWSLFYSKYTINLSTTVNFWLHTRCFTKSSIQDGWKILRSVKSIFNRIEMPK